MILFPLPPFLLFSLIFSSPSVYKAAGLGAYDLYDEVDYDTWYSSQLLNELRIQDPRSE